MRKSNLKKKNSEPFKQCPLCETVWETKEDFLDDQSVRLNGYQATSRLKTGIRKNGLLLFTHHRRKCGTTLALYAISFKNNIQSQSQ